MLTAGPRAEALHLLVLAKAPVPGEAKTRLCPPCTPVQAARLAEAALRDTLTAVAATPAARRSGVLQGPAGPWLPSAVDVLPQRGGGLDERLAAAFDDGWARARLPLLLVGMDTPQLTPAVLSAAVPRMLAEGTDAVLGLAPDGGWWALGLRRPDAALLLGVSTSTSSTGALQRERLVAAGLRLVDLPEVADVDTVGRRPRGRPLPRHVGLLAGRARSARRLAVSTVLATGGAGMGAAVVRVRRWTAAPPTVALAVGP